MLSTRAYATHAIGMPLTPFVIERREPGPHDILIDILYCGICHTDIHLTRGEFPSPLFPMVPGHEIVGKIFRTGSAVTRFKPGDCVGVGCLVDSCRVCAECQAGEEQYCDGMVSTYNAYEDGGKTHTYGGYSGRMTIDENYALSISPKLDLAATAPLLCAGITTYAPLRQWNVGKHSKVGVIGLGGLGHIAVKLAAAMGATVTVFSTSDKKRIDALRLGAVDFAVTSEPESFTRLAGRFDLVLNTVSADIPYDSYISLLKRGAALILLGIPNGPVTLNALGLLMKRRCVASSMIGGIRETQEMLDFCAEHDVVSDIEVISIEDVNRAYERILAQDVRYRFVIDMASLG